MTILKSFLDYFNDFARSQTDPNVTNNTIIVALSWRLLHRKFMRTCSLEVWSLVGVSVWQRFWSSNLDAFLFQDVTELFHFRYSFLQVFLREGLTSIFVVKVPVLLVRVCLQIEREGEGVIITGEIVLHVLKKDHPAVE